jgi:hypothetical protein
MTSRRTSEDDEELNKFDIDAFTRDYRVATRPGKKEHVFGRAEVSRGDWNFSDESESRDPHDRFNQGPSMQRYVKRPFHIDSASEYEAAMHSRFSVMPLHTVARHHSPMLSPVYEALIVLTLPGSLRPSSSRYWTAIRHRYLTWAQDKKLAVHAGLTTSTAVASQIRAVEQIVKRLIGIEEREALCNGLQVMAEEYDEGWDSGTDSDDDG